MILIRECHYGADEKPGAPLPRRCAVGLSAAAVALLALLLSLSMPVNLLFLLCLFRGFLGVDLLYFLNDFQPEFGEGNRLRTCARATFKLPA